jgi:homoserine O-acetyltransferase
MTNDEIDVLMDDFAEEKLFMDIYDFKMQNDSIINYNLEDKLSNIKAKTLVIAPKDDLYFSKEFDILPLKDMIADCEIQIFDLSDEYYEGNIDFAEFSNILYGFLKNFD